MSSIKDIVDQVEELNNNQSGADALNDPKYFEQSDKVIAEALQQGFDVIQLENGDIVTTGTEIVTTQYRWNADKQKMSKRVTRETQK